MALVDDLEREVDQIIAKDTWKTRDWDVFLNPKTLVSGMSL